MTDIARYINIYISNTPLVFIVMQLALMSIAMGTALTAARIRFDSERRSDGNYSDIVRFLARRSGTIEKFALAMGFFGTVCGLVVLLPKLMTRQVDSEVAMALCTTLVGLITAAVCYSTELLLPMERDLQENRS